MSVPWDFTLSHIVAYTISSHNCHRNVSLPSGASLWNVMFGRVEGQYTTILLGYGHPKETDTAIMMLYKNTKVKVHLLDGDTDYFGIVAGVLLEDTLALYLFIICLDYVL